MGLNAWMWSPLISQVQYLHSSIFSVFILLVLRYAVWSTGSSCGQMYQHELTSNWNWFTVTPINSTIHVHAYFYIFLLFVWYVTFTSEIVLIDSINHGYGTNACLHHIWNDICVVNDSGVHFYFSNSAEASSPVKVPSFLMKFYDSYG